VVFLKRNIVIIMTALLIFTICFMGIGISAQKKSIDRLQEENNIIYIRCLEQIANGIEDYKKAEEDVSLRNASSWAGKAVIVSKSMSFEKKQYLESIAIMLDEFFSKTTRPDSAAKTEEIYKLIPCLRSVAENPNDKQKIDNLTYTLQSTY